MGSFFRCLDYVIKVAETQSPSLTGTVGEVALASAVRHPLPDDCAQAFITDPPYYDAVPYADLSDFFYVWFKRNLGHVHPDLFAAEMTPKEDEIVQLAERNKAYRYKTKERFEQLMRDALAEGRRVTAPAGLGVVVFAHKETGAWETSCFRPFSMPAGWSLHHGQLTQRSLGV